MEILTSFTLYVFVFSSVFILRSVVVFFGFVLCFLIAIINKAELKDFEIKTVSIKGDFIIHKSNYERFEMEEVSFTFFVEEDEKEYVLDGDLLKLAEQSIRQLKSGDKIEIWIKKDNKRNFFDNLIKHGESIWGIKHLSGKSLLMLETSIKYKKRDTKILHLGLFLMMAFVCIFLI